MGLGATMGANFLGACCWEMEILALPRDGVVSILAATCPVCSFPLPWFHMALKKNKEIVFKQSDKNMTLFQSNRREEG